jgi:YfiH family protein
MGVRGPEPDEIVHARRAILSEAVACKGVAPTGVRQVHGSRIVRLPEEHDGRSPAPEADGLFTTQSGRPLLVLGADCPGLAIVPEDGSALAVVHAGWRGIAAGVHLEALSLMRSVTNAPLHAVVGPSIGLCCYEVGPEVVAALDSPEEDRGMRLLRRGEGDRSYVHPAGVLEWSLRRAAGEINITTLSAGCTRCSADRWFSHRAGDEGRHALVAALVPEVD